MDIDKETAKKKAQKLKEGFTRLSKDVKAGKFKSAQKQFKELEDIYATLAEALNIRKSYGFSDFFTEVGQSVVEAQGQLDDRSRDYLNDARTAEHIPPTIFRLPKLTAEIKFAFEEMKKKKMGLVFYSDIKKATEQHQQSLQFEIVAAPPPPEVIAKLQKQPLLPQLLVLSSATRKNIFEAVKRIDATVHLSEPDLKKIKENIGKNRNKILIFTDELGKSDNSFFLLVHIKDATAEIMRMLYLKLEPLTLKSVFKHTVKKKPEGYNLLIKKVVTLAGLQKELLDKIR